MAFLFEHLVLFDVGEELEEGVEIVEGLKDHGARLVDGEGGLEALKLADVLMVTLNPDDLSQRAVIAAAQDAGVGILLKKVFASGHADPRESLGLALNEPGVGSVVTGTINPAHLEENAAIADAVIKGP